MHGTILLARRSVLLRFFKLLSLLLWLNFSRRRRCRRRRRQRRRCCRRLCRRRSRRRHRGRCRRHRRLSAVEREEPESHS